MLHSDRLMAEGHTTVAPRIAAFMPMTAGQYPNTIFSHVFSPFVLLTAPTAILPLSGHRDRTTGSWCSPSSPQDGGRRGLNSPMVWKPPAWRPSQPIRAFSSAQMAAKDAMRAASKP